MYRFVLLELIERDPDFIGFKARYYVHHCDPWIFRVACLRSFVDSVVTCSPFPIDTPRRPSSTLNLPCVPYPSSLTLLSSLVSDEK